MLTFSFTCACLSPLSIQFTLKKILGSLFFLREIDIWHVTEILDKNSALCRNHRFSISFISSRIRGCDTKWKSYQILNFKERERDSYIVTPRCENSRLLICPLTGHYTLELTELIVQRITVS